MIAVGCEAERCDLKDRLALESEAGATKCFAQGEPTRNKTDAVDAGVPARFGQLMRPEPWVHLLQRYASCARWWNGCRLSKTWLSKKAIFSRPQ